MNKNKYISEQIERLIELEVIKKQNKIKNELLLIKKRLNDKTFRIAVVGEFSSGKSTFINAMIGKDILKHASSETTAAITHIINVEADDERIGKCEIEFSSGEKEMTNTDMLKKYTTVNGEYDVASDIRCVSVYVHFLDVDYPLVISDTPGLNGIADKHREITLEEIKKAHTCIYLLSNNGVKLSDKDFLKIIMNYQSRFIFIQNFIDLLRISEGETKERKLSGDEELINDCIGDNKEVVYDIYGISAVKALAAKDTSKNKVFADDIDPITDRDALMTASNFKEFEEGLADIINSGEYLDIICSSAVQALEHIFGIIGSELDAQQELNDSLRSSDDREKRNKKLREKLADFTEQIPTRKKTLDTFIQARDFDNRSTLKEHLKCSLNDLYEDVTKKINSEIKVYEDFERIETENGCTVPKYYSKYVSQKINSAIIPDLNGRAVESLDHIYEEALMRITDFVSAKSGRSKKIEIDIVQEKADFESKFRSEKDKIRSDKEQLELAKNKHQTARNSINESSQQLIKCDDELAQVKVERQRIESSGNRELNSLGIDPGVQKKAVTKTRAVSRSGLFGWIADIFSTKYENYTDYEDDYTAQNEWKARKSAVQDEIDNKLRAQDKLIGKVIQKRDKIARDIEQNEQNAAKYDADIKYLSEKIKNAEKQYEVIIKQHKREFCVSEKKKLTDDIHRALLDKKNPYCTLYNMQTHIDKISDENLAKITAKVMEYFDSSVQEKTDMLNGLIDKNEEALKSQYELSKRESDTLNEIRNNCRGVIEE